MLSYNHLTFSRVTNSKFYGTSTVSNSIPIYTTDTPAERGKAGLPSGITLSDQRGAALRFEQNRGRQKHIAAISVDVESIIMYH